VKGNKIAAIYVETRDASEKAHGVLRIFDFSGKLLNSYTFDLDVFGTGLIDWFPGRLLMATQTGSLERGPKLAFIEAVP
jgi:hypothetical protein